MIARISNPGNFLAGAIQYNTAKVEFGGGELIASHNFQLGEGTSIDVATATHLMLAQLELNSRVEKGVFSCNLNLNLEDISNIEKLQSDNNCESKDEFYDKLAAEYMKGMGYGNQPYLVFRHNDIEREHIHIVSIRVDENGNRISNFNEHKRSERVRNELNKSFGLSTKGEIKGKDLDESQRITLAENRYDFMERTKRSIFAYNEAVNTWSEIAAPDKKEMVVKQNQTNLFHHVSNALKYVNENYQPKNLKEYNKILAQFNIVCKKNEGESTEGKRFSGCQYAVLNENGEICSHLMKGSSFGKAYSLNGLNKRFALANDKKSLLENAEFSKKYIASTVDAVLKAPVKLDFESLSTHLKERGITVNLVRDFNDPNKVKGLSFIDNINGTAFNGNNLGKAYSYANICKSINLHNVELEKSTSNNRREKEENGDRRVPKQSSFVPKEQYNEAVKLLNRAFNSVRNENYYLESDAIRSLKNRNVQFEEVLQGQLLFTAEQAARTFESFRKLKERNLDDIDFKETSLQQKRITIAVQFAQHIPNEQDKVDFLDRAGVSVGRYYDKLVFSSQFKSSVKLTFDEICERTKGSAEPVSIGMKPFDPFNIPEPAENLDKISKAERLFVNSFVQKEDNKITGDFTGVASLLGKDEQQIFANKLYIPKEEFISSLKPLNACFRNIMRNGSYKYQSDLIRDIDLHKDVFIEALTGNGNNYIKSERLYNIYKENVLQKLPKTITDEKEVAINRIIAASLFARNIDDPSFKSEFLMRMGVHAEVNDGVLVLSRDDKREYNITWEELTKREPRLTEEDQLFVQSVPAPSNPEARLFSKKERDFVNTLNNNSWMKDNPDGRFCSAIKYLNTTEKAKATRLGNSVRIQEILQRNPDATILNTVKALWSRGYIIKPFKNEGKTEFKIGMHNANDDTYISLPFDIQQRLHNTNYIATYPKMNQLVLNGKWNSPKMETLKDITRAADYGDVDLLQSRIEKVAQTNMILANAMREAMGNPSNPDYERVANLVFNYQGEHTIILPPPTDSKNSFVKKRDDEKLGHKSDSYYDMISALQNCSALQYIEQRAMDRIKQEEQENKNKGKALN